MSARDKFHDAVKHALAVPIYAYQSFFYRDLPQAAIEKYKVDLIIYDPIKEVNTQWIN